MDNKKNGNNVRYSLFLCWLVPFFYRGRTGSRSETTGLYNIHESLIIYRLFLCDPGPIATRTMIISIYKHFSFIPKGGVLQRKIIVLICVGIVHTNLYNGIS